MTNEEALEIIDDSLGAGRISVEAENITFWETVRSAVEKQILKKPQTRLIRSNEYEQVIDGYCPSCFARQSVGGRSWHKVFNKFCIDCGQRLDWSEE